MAEVRVRFTKNYTAKEAAYDIAVNALNHAFRHDDLDDYADTPSKKQRVRRQIAKLHNKLLDQCSLIGIGLDEDAP